MSEMESVLKTRILSRCLSWYLCAMGGEADEPTFLLQLDLNLLEG